MEHNETSIRYHSFSFNIYWRHLNVLFNISGLFLDLGIRLESKGFPGPKAKLMGKDYSGTKFFYTEPLFLNKAHSTK